MTRVCSGPLVRVVAQATLAITGMTTAVATCTTGLYGMVANRSKLTTM